MGWRSPWVFLLAGFLLHAQSKGPDATAQQANPAAAAPSAPPFVTCPAGAPLGAIDLEVQAGPQHLPFRTINHLGEGDTLRYSPILRGKEKRPGEIALVLVPQKRQPGQEDILVTDPKPADKPEEWKITQTISLAALVYGPAGLSRKKVVKFLSQDEVLIAQLADYADKTAQAEQLVATLSNSESSAASVNAALSGFASEYGFAVQINRNAPVASQAATVFAAMNPQLAAYNPLASSTAQRVGQTASLATMAGTLFFGSPIGLAAGGTAMLLDLRAIAFPDTQFRASFAQPLDRLRCSDVNLCGQQTAFAAAHQGCLPLGKPHPEHLRRRPSASATRISSPPPRRRLFRWRYPSPDGNTWIARGNGRWSAASRRRVIPVVKLGNQNALELDLTKAKLSAGRLQVDRFLGLDAFGGHRNRACAAAQRFQKGPCRSGVPRPSAGEVRQGSGDAGRQRFRVHDQSRIAKTERRIRHAGKRSVSLAEGPARRSAGPHGRPDRHARPRSRRL